MKRTLFLPLIAALAGTWLGIAPADAADNPQVIYGLLVVGAIGLFLNRLAAWIEARALAWRSGGR